MAAACALVALGGCSASKAPATPQPDAVTGATRARVEAAVKAEPHKYLPRAIIYKTNGDYDDNVAVQIGGGGVITSYPAPTDVSPSRSTPLHVAGGYLLDRRGIGPGTAFLRYTYADYAALPSAPTPQQLRDSIIPGARITAIYSLPMTPAEAQADTAAVNRIILTDPGALTPLGTSPRIARMKP